LGTLALKGLKLCIHEIDAVLGLVANETVDREVPLIVLHKAVLTETATQALTDNPETTTKVLPDNPETTTKVLPDNPETTTKVLLDNPETTERFFTHLSENNDSTKVDVNITTPINPSPVSVTLTTEQQVLNESTISLNGENSTVSISTEYETSTTMIETTIELTTTEATTSTSVVPADCPALKDCPFDYCAFARKLDNRGCSTCNCLNSNKSNITCPILTCQACLYGHYTDPNGVYILM
jgi:hypothetical protein